MTPSTATAAAACKLVILYGIGGLSDVGRHAILAALEQPTVQTITVITEYPELLDKSYWDCNCTTGGHTNPSKEGPHASKIQLVGVENNSWKTPQPNLAQHFQGADAVISCLGHRQPALSQKGLVAKVGNEHVIRAMIEARVERAVICSSIGIQDDWPPMEFHFFGTLMALLFQSFSRKAFRDLTAMEQAYHESDLDYLMVRPVGLGEDVEPVGEWFVQEEKGVDAVGPNMAKMDCARYMVQEALEPTKHRMGAVVGSKPPPLPNEEDPPRPGKTK